MNSDNATQKRAVEELRDLFINQIQDSERIGIVLNCISESNEHQKSSTKKELVKVIGILAEIFHDRLLEFLPRILHIITKRLRENDTQVNATCADTIGVVISICLRELALDQSYKHLTTIFRTFFNIFTKNSKQAQIGAALCIAKAVQMSQIESLYSIVDELVQKLIDIMKSSSCQAHLQIIEAMLSLILAAEDNHEKLKISALMILPVIIENMPNPDWNVRKISVEVIYTISVLIPEVLLPSKQELLETLNQLRFDRVLIIY